MGEFLNVIFISFLTHNRVIYLTLESRNNYTRLCLIFYKTLNNAGFNIHLLHVPLYRIVFILLVLFQYKTACRYFLFTILTFPTIISMKPAHNVTQPYFDFPSTYSSESVSYSISPSFCQINIHKNDLTTLG